MNSFAYDAQTTAGQPIRGTIEAPDIDAAQQQLTALGLRILKLEATTKPLAKPLSGTDFLAFNEQLAQLTAAGLPVDRGLRLIAADLRSGRLKKTVEAIALSLEQGKSLDQAFAEHQGVFHPLYGRIVEAGVKSGNLPAVLLSLGRHLDTTRRLRTELVRAIAYPLLVLAAVGILLTFLGRTVFPQIISAYLGNGTTVMDFSTWQRVPMDDSLPMITKLVAVSAAYIGPVILVLSLIALAIPLLWQTLPAASTSRFVERVLWRVPLVGPVLRKSLISRWLDVVRIGVGTGMDLPQALTLAGGAVAAEPLRADSLQLATTLESGRTLDATGQLRWLPRSVPSVLDVASQAGHLHQTLAALSQSNQQQADQKLSLIPAVLTPLMLSFVALVIVCVLLALLAPLNRMFQWMAF